MPICITDACDGEDLEVALEKAVKCKFVIEDVDCSGDPFNVPIFKADQKNKSSSSSAATNSGSVITALANASSLIAAMV